MYCQNCGEKLPKDAKFCQNCGTQVNNSNDKVKSNVIDTNGILDSSVDVVKSGSDEFRKKWSSWSSKRKFLSVIVCCCIGWIIVSSLMGALTPDKNAESRPAERFPRLRCSPLHWSLPYCNVH